MRRRRPACCSVADTMARKRDVPVPPDRELDRLYRRFESLSAKVAANEFKSEMGGSRLADMKLRYQVPKLERVRIAQGGVQAEAWKAAMDVADLPPVIPYERLSPVDLS